MKRIFSRFLLCLFLCVLFLSLIYSNCLEVNGIYIFPDSSYDDCNYIRSEFADLEGLLINYTNDLKYQYSKNVENVVNYDVLDDLFYYLSKSNYCISNSNSFLSTVSSNIRLLEVFFYNGDDSISWGTDSFGFINSFHVFVFWKTPDNKYLLESIDYSKSLEISYYVYAYRSEQINNFLKENYYDSSIKSNSEIISDALKEEGEKNRQHYEEMLWGTGDSNSDSTSLSNDDNKDDEKKKGIVQSILDGITNIFIKVFVPGDDYFKNYFDDLNNFFSDRFGFLYYPFELIIKVLNGFMNIGEYDNSVEPVNYYLPSVFDRDGDIYSYSGSYNYLLRPYYNCPAFDLKKGQILSISFTLLECPSGVGGPVFNCYKDDVYFKDVSFSGSFTDLNNEHVINYTASEDCHISYRTGFYKGQKFKFICKVEDSVLGAGSFSYPDIPEPFTKSVLIRGGTINLNDTFKTEEFKQVYDYYLMFVDFIIAILLISLALRKWEEVVR